MKILNRKLYKHNGNGIMVMAAPLGTALDEKVEKLLSIK
jgi:hypothetical protein